MSELNLYTVLLGGYKLTLQKTDDQDDDLCSRKELSVLWLGNNSWLIHHNGILLATDIDLASDYRIEDSPVSAKDIAPYLDVHFISHSHSDHPQEHDMACISNNRLAHYLFA